MMKEKIKAFCESIGLDTLGFIPCRRFDELENFYKERYNKGLQNEFEEKDLKKRIAPHHYMKEGKTIISIAFPYYQIEDDAGYANGFSVYTKRVDYHRVVKKYLDEIIDYLQSLGGQALGFVDSNTLPERYIAYLAGLGFIGRNNMLITPKYGSYVFLGEIITDLEIDCQEVRSFEEVSRYKECGSCENCICACPTKSIHKKQINPNICLSYLTQKKELTPQEIKLLKGNVFGCDFCQRPCPYNEQKEKGVLKAFETLAYMNEEAWVYATMDNAWFKEKISATSCGWRGKNVIRRNAIIRLYEQGIDVSGLRGDSPYINGYIDQLLNRLNSKI